MSQLISCQCGCGEFRNRIDSQGRIRYFKKGHPTKGRRRPEISESKHWNWHGGKNKNWSGYWLVYCPEHPHATLAGYVREHRLIMEQHLGRYLSDNEIVHHINGIITDNRIENLQLLKRADHAKLHMLEYSTKIVSKRLCILCRQKTLDSNGPRWYKFKDGYLCQRCWSWRYTHRK